MKKIVFILVLLLFTAPAWATTVIIDANQVVPGSNEVVITYEVVAPDVNLPRAFGLDITVTDGNIIACIPYMEGECTDSDKGFGIFPGSIVIDDAPPIPQIIDAGNPAALAGATGALGGLDTNGITIELGSLYQDANAPPLSGVLCTIVITKDCIVRIAGNAARCGESSPAIGVVMEDLDEIPNVTFGTADVNIDDEECIPSAHPDYDEWVLVGKPLSWCGSGKQCHGDATGSDEEYGRDNWVSVGLADVQLLLTGYNDNTYADPATHPWIAADFTHSKEEYGRDNWVRVGLADVQELLIYYNAHESTVPDDCLDVP